MARRRKKRRGLSFSNPFSSLDSGIMRSVWSVILTVFAIFLMLAGLGSAGIVGGFFSVWLQAFFGWGYPVLSIALLLVAYILIKPEEHYSFGTIRLASAAIFFLSGLGILEIMFGRGGYLGALIAHPIETLFAVYVTSFILWGLALISLIILLDLKLTTESFPFLTRIFLRHKDEEKYTVTGNADDTPPEEESDEPDEDEGVPEPPAPLSAPKTRPSQKTADMPFAPIHGGAYTPPPLSLLEKDRGKPGVGDIKANANIIRRTLQNFGIHVEIDEISIGPSVTRYALKPAEGVRLSRIMGLQNNLELALAAHPVRIEAPIPGRSLVGIEVPNTAKTTVGLATLLAREAYQRSEKPLLVTLGKDITGESQFADISKMPHLLIAGATGSGKSVTIHSLIISLLFRNSPEMLRFIMVDPKRVELTLYNNIPHLLTPVITDAKKTILALKWAAKEMDRRYDILETEHVRDVASYHKNILEPAVAAAKKNGGEDMPEAMPYILIVIDELADIMQAYPRELEAAVVRIAQMSRAVGIHLILSTQRPSVNVITGLIKANIPARVALQVSSQIDSRTILDAGGAEKLLGAGDMLYLSGEMSKPKRIQSAFVSETELKKITSFLIKHNEDNVPSEIEFSNGNGDIDRGTIFDATFDDTGDEEDELYEEARDIVVHAGKASTSYLQRKLRVGYARAARLMDLLEERGIIGPADGSRPRDILYGREDTTSEDDEDDEQ